MDRSHRLNQKIHEAAHVERELASGTSDRMDWYAQRYLVQDASGQRTFLQVSRNEEGWFELYPLTRQFCCV